MSKKFESLLSIIVTDLNREYLLEQKRKLCIGICSDYLKGTVNPNEIDIEETNIPCYDKNRIFVNLRMKKGFDMVIPVDRSKSYAKRLNKRLYS